MNSEKERQTMGESNQGIQFYNKGNVSITGPVAIGKNAKAVQGQPAPDGNTHEQQQQVIRVLLLFTNPFDTSRLQLDKEERVIKEGIRRSKYRDTIQLAERHATTLHDLRHALQDEPCNILHIAAHGNTTALILANEQGSSHPIPAGILAEYLKSYRPALQCVIFNVCKSALLAQEVSLGIHYAIGVEADLDDEIAIEFSRGFYDALGAGYEIKRAYEEGIHTARMGVPGIQAMPELFCDGQYM
jgi:hypothetical protein